VFASLWKVVPAEQAAHVRSLETVSAADSYSPAEHTARILPQAAPSSEALKVVPRSQAAHWRSALALPAVDWPWPAAHVPQVAHDALAAAALNCPDAQSAQSPVASCPAGSDCARYLPVPQLLHARGVAVRAVASWYLPDAHTVQAVPSALLAASPVRYLPRAQAIHAACSVLGWYWPLAQASQVSCCAGVPVAWEVPAGQTVQLAASAAAYLPAGHVWHNRSFDTPGAVLWNSPAAHVVTAAQASPSLEALKVVPETQAAHWRSVEASGVLLSPWPAGQVVKAAQALASSTALKVTSALQAVHVASAVMVPAAYPVPAAQVVTVSAVQVSVSVLLEEAAALNLPVGHSAHTRSLLAVAAVVVL